jgi:hypothetical protein
MRDLNEKQMRFVEAYLLGETASNGAASVVVAGFAADCAKQTAYRLLRHDGVRAEIARQRAIILGSELANKSVSRLRMILDAEPMTAGHDYHLMKLQLEASKLVLALAGHVAPKAPEPTQELHKSTKAMSYAELVRMLKVSEERIGAMIDITPDAQPDAHDERGD